MGRPLLLRGQEGVKTDTADTAFTCVLYRLLRPAPGTAPGRAVWLAGRGAGKPAEAQSRQPAGLVAGRLPARPPRLRTRGSREGGATPSPSQMSRRKRGPEPRRHSLRKPRGASRWRFSAPREENTTTRRAAMRARVVVRTLVSRPRRFFLGHERIKRFQFARSPLQAADSTSRSLPDERCTDAKRAEDRQRSALGFLSW